MTEKWDNRCINCGLPPGKHLHVTVGEEVGDYYKTIRQIQASLCPTAFYDPRGISEEVEA